MKNILKIQRLHIIFCISKENCKLPPKYYILSSYCNQVQQFRAEMLSKKLAQKFANKIMEIQNKNISLTTVNKNISSQSSPQHDIQNTSFTELEQNSYLKSEMDDEQSSQKYNKRSYQFQNGNKMHEQNYKEYSPIEGESEEIKEYEQNKKKNWPKTRNQQKIQEKNQKKHYNLQINRPNLRSKNTQASTQKKKLTPAAKLAQKHADKHIIKIADKNSNKQKNQTNFKPKIVQIKIPKIKFPGNQILWEQKSDLQNLYKKHFKNNHNSYTCYQIDCDSVYSIEQDFKEFQKQKAKVIIQKKNKKQTNKEVKPEKYSNDKKQSKHLKTQENEELSMNQRNQVKQLVQSFMLQNTEVIAEKIANILKTQQNLELNEANNKKESVCASKKTKNMPKNKNMPKPQAYNRLDTFSEKLKNEQQEFETFLNDKKIQQNNPTMVDKEKILEMIDLKVEKIQRNNHSKLNMQSLKRLIIAEALRLVRTFNVDKKTEESIIKEWIARKKEKESRKKTENMHFHKT